MYDTPLDLKLNLEVSHIWTNNHTKRKSQETTKQEKKTRTEPYTCKRDNGNIKVWRSYAGMKTTFNEVQYSKSHNKITSQSLWRVNGGPSTKLRSAAQNKQIWIISSIYIQESIHHQMDFPFVFGTNRITTSSSIKESHVHTNPTRKPRSLQLNVTWVKRLKPLGPSL